MRENGRLADDWRKSSGPDRYSVLDYGVVVGADLDQVLARGDIADDHLSVVLALTGMVNPATNRVEITPCRRNRIARRHVEDGRPECSAVAQPPSIGIISMKIPDNSSDTRAVPQEAYCG